MWKTSVMEATPEIREFALQRSDRTRRLRLVAATCSALAAAIHVGVLPEHASQSRLFAVAFALMALAQSSWAAVIVTGRDRRPFMTGAVINGAIALLWIMSRTTGLPIGPHPWSAETIGFADLTATVAELVVVGTVLRLITSAAGSPHDGHAMVRNGTGIVQRLTAELQLLPATVRAGFVLLAFGVVVSVTQHATAGGHASADHASSGLLGHLIVLVGMVVSMVGVFGQALVPVEKARDAGERRTK